MRLAHVRALTAVVASVWVLAACEWVDSASDGNGGQTLSLFDITLDEQPLGGAVQLLESSGARLVVSNAVGDQTRTVHFDETPVAEGVLDSCLAINGFTRDRAVDSLSDACSNGVDDCRFDVQLDSTSPDELALQLTVPRLRAPVGRRHTIVIGRELTGDDGELLFSEESRRTVDFCLIAVNEAPDAQPDTYLLVEGGQLNVNAANGVLANDSDDDDAGNEPLRVATTPAAAPQLADQFELRADGSFSYSAPETGLREDVIDGFAYTVTDGQQSSRGEVTVRIAAANQAPVLLETPDLLEAMVGREFEADLSVFFEDPEGLDLSFSLVGELPDEGDLLLSEDGLLSGTPEEGDEGEYVLTLVADDGGSTTETLIMLLVEEQNLPPVYVDGSVANRTQVLGRAMNPVEPEFIDPEGEPLTYSSVGTDLPPGVSVDEDTGVVSGTPTARGTVRNIVIQAEDPAGNTAESDTFLIRTR